MTAKGLGLLKQLQSYSSEFLKKENTLFLYEIYKEGDRQSLIHLHCFAKKIIDPNHKIKVDYISEGRTQIPIYSSAQDQKEPFSQKTIKIDENTQEDELTSIRIFELNESRVVAIPIPERMLLNQQTAEYSSLISKQKEDKKELQGKKKEEAKKKKQDQLKQKLEKQVNRNENIFLFKLKLAALTQALINTSNSIIICNLLEYAGSQVKTIKEYQTFFEQIFASPEDLKLHLIYYSYDERLKRLDQEKFNISHPSVVGLFTIEKDDKVGLKSNEWFHKDYAFTPKKGTVKINLLSNIVKQNIVMLKIIDNFREQIVKMGQNFSSTIGSTLSETSKKIGQTDLPQYLSFEDLNKQYGLMELNLHSVKDLTLSQFYTEERKNKIGIEGNLDISKIPPTLTSLLLAHEICNVMGPFIDNKEYNQKLLKYNRDQTAVLIEWKPALKQIYELIKSLRKDIKSDLIEGCYNVLCFIIDSCILLNKIAKVEIGLSTAFKVMFEKLLPSRDKISMYVIDNQENIENKQEVNYYSIYLALLSENVTTNEAKQTECTLRELRVEASKRSSITMSNYKFIVRTIKDLAILILDYQNLSITKRSYEKIINSEQSLIKLLACVGKDQISAEICFKHRTIGKAHKYLKFAKKNYRDDKKANKLLKWGEQIQKELEYELALQYYREAYDSAKDTELAKKAVQKKIECRKKIREEQSQQIIYEFKEFTRPDNTSIEKFTSKSDLTRIYTQIKNSLKWDEKNERGTFEDLEDEEGNPSFLN